MSSYPIENNFTYHPPTAEQIELYKLIRDTAKVFAILVAKTCPESRERSLALTNIEQSVMWANAAIARNSGASE